jgi:PPOX class probable F420-dependent enzyme
MSWLSRFTAIETRLLDRARSAAAARAAVEPPTGRVEDFAGRKHCVLVTYRRNGAPTPTPVWFGTAHGKLYVHTGGAKIKRLAVNPKVRVAPATFRGRPVCPPLAATARVLSAAEEGIAERAVQANYGWGRKLYYRLITQRDLGVYVEITPDAVVSEAGIE